MSSDIRRIKQMISYSPNGGNNKSEPLHPAIFSFFTSRAHVVSLSYKVFGLIEQYSDQRPTLVFCATRNGAKNLALQLLKEATSSETQQSIFFRDGWLFGWKCSRVIIT